MRDRQPDLGWLLLLGLALVVAVGVATAAPSTAPSADVEAWQSSSSTCGVEISGTFGTDDEQLSRVVVDVDDVGVAADRVLAPDDFPGDRFSASTPLTRGASVEVIALDDDRPPKTLATGRLTSACEFAEGSP